MLMRSRKTNVSSAAVTGSSRTALLPRFVTRIVRPRALQAPAIAAPAGELLPDAIARMVDDFDTDPETGRKTSAEAGAHPASIWRNLPDQSAP